MKGFNGQIGLRTSGCLDWSKGQLYKKLKMILQSTSHRTDTTNEVC